MITKFSRVLMQAAEQFNEKLALVNVERNRTFTFKELHLLTNKICNMMKDQLGMKKDDIYGTILANDNMSLFGSWTMTKSYFKSVTLSYRDSLEEHLYKIDHVGPNVMFVEKEILEIEGYYEGFRKRNIKMIVMDPLDEKLEGVDYFWDVIEQASDAEIDNERDDEEIINYRFTGGTTGKGKCTQYSLRNNLAGIHQQSLQPDSSVNYHTRFLHVHPITHVSGTYMLPAYLKGGTSYTINNADLDLFGEVVQKYKITDTLMVPTLLYRLLDYGIEKKYNLESLQTVIYGASPMSPTKLKKLQETFGNIFMQLYGASEGGSPMLILSKSDHIVKKEEDMKRLASAGRILPGVELKIVDDDENEVPNGEIGEICIRSASVIKGYYKNPEETKKAFTENGFWKSGDMGYKDENGYIYIVDRKKDMIITGGFNVYATEVENVLNSHEAVQQSVVFGVPDEEWGELVSCEVILRENATVTEEELKEFMKRKLASYKVPKSIIFVDELPLTPVGKILRRKVREKYWKAESRKVH